jgi:beta-glucan synthesis-associated protein KRE6
MRGFLQIFAILSGSCFQLQVFGGWIDPDTSSHVKTIKSYYQKGEKYDLVFSDEFEINDRTFSDGNDPKWTSIEKNDYTNDALQYYRDHLVRTNNGSLVISTILEDINFHAFSNEPNEPNKLAKMTKNYQSGMVQGWNKFCFTGGIVEVSAKLPGHAYIGGLWPAMWLLGNLARATYVQSSDNMWPWSYDECSRELQREQEISKCNSMNHFEFHKFQGRGAPEIDILEAMPGKEKLKNTPVNRPYYSASLQISPATEEDRPVLGQHPLKTTKNWYQDGLEYGDNSSVNIYFYGTVLKNENDESKSYQTDAISANRELLPTHFDEFHKYRIEWKTGDEGYIRWWVVLVPFSTHSLRYLDSRLVFALNSDTLKLNNAIIPEEPMSVFPSLTPLLFVLIFLSSSSFVTGISSSTQQ